MGSKDVGRRWTKQKFSMPADQKFTGILRLPIYHYKSRQGYRCRLWSFFIEERYHF